ncbi:hypothetical protein CAOG_05139 [Capsaspora owczarzaki ATCC 30864]|uniref:t-SNARE coiled-coil homology domain-containing protein n=1 Tax=Capsaspora owczarzaki (strain ATCC 30864) TaxID=595528 RepID=A0A0D2UHB8_CAPO3|nr:hypothetical protein CAOG_05139 [Capsaspora owczarzaki ATCC 30864]KJE94506.1 hypothetical protein CAOG_005139 [Capsaspora owczarzaki ATCC 30864]|eukprot:XP_004346824.1 hypothetical protein CAOG_05139 [Capsaspora owczarzaki ATCC 30864]
MASSELFENYEFEFTNISASITKKLSSQIPNFTGEQRKAAIKAVEKEIVQADEIVQGMELELKNAPAQFRPRLQTKLKTYQNELARIKKELRGLTNSGNRDDLLGGGSGAGSPAGFGGRSAYQDVEAQSNDQRSRILDSHDRLNRTTGRLDNAQRVAAESEAIGQDILGELGTQRETIVRVRGRLHETDDNLTRSRRILNGMYYRIIQNRLIMYIIVLVLMGILGIVVYMRFFKK